MEQTCVSSSYETLEERIRNDKSLATSLKGNTLRENCAFINYIGAMKKRHAQMWRNLEIQCGEKVAHTNELLQTRIEELYAMSESEVTISILPSLTEAQLKLVENLTDKNSVDFMAERKKKRNWTLLDHFKHAARMVLIMVNGFNDSRRRYHHIDAMSKQPIMGNSSDIFVDVAYEKKANILPGMAPALYMALISQPENKSHEEITQILWVVRASKSFRDLFPDDMEYELARRVSYERYDEGRVIAYQKRLPDKFYFVISGRVSLLSEFKLNTGVVTRIIGHMKKGEHSNVEELEKQQPRQFHLVAKGGVELLSLEKEDFFYLTKVNVDLPLGFLQTVEIFDEFPVEKFKDEPEAIWFRYYGRGQVVVNDSNRTPWILVIKTGRLKVVRLQPILDINSCTSYVKDAVKRPADPLRTKTKRTSHANAMLGVLTYQQKIKSMVQSRQSVSSTDSMSSLSQLSRRNMLKVNEGKKIGKRNKGLTIPVMGDTPSGMITPELKDINASSPAIQEKENEAPPNDFVLPVMINIPKRHLSEALKSAERSWIEKDFKIPQLPKLVYTTQDSPRQIPERKTYVQLDILREKTVFGLHHLHEAKFSEPKGYTLVSDGAEVIGVSKRYFIQHVNNNSMLKVETMFKDYMTSKQAKDALYQSANWEQYRRNTLNDTVKLLTRTRL